jgi:hypothetical protein
VLRQNFCGVNYCRVMLRFWVAIVVPFGKKGMTARVQQQQQQQQQQQRCVY